MSQETQLNLDASRSIRRYDFDWLKVAATLTVFIFHCLRFFDLEAWHVKNAQLSAVATVFAGLLLQWIMPLFFVLSGASIYFALKVRTAEQFLRERCMRLLIPLFFGIFILSPPQVYLERLSNPDRSVAPWNGGWQFSGSFWEFIPFYFQGWYLFGGNFAWMGLHLWYLLALFLFSLLLLPLFLRIKRGKKEKLMATLRSFNSWCWIMTFLSLGRKFLNFSHPSLRYMSEASLPFYILHQPIIIFVGFVIAGWDLGVLPKFMLLSLGG